MRFGGNKNSRDQLTGFLSLLRFTDVRYAC